MASSPLVYFNGIDPHTGAYAVEPVEIGLLAQQIRAELAVSYAEYCAAVEQLNTPDRTRTWGGREGVDYDSVREGGWAIVHHADEPQETLDALERLYRHRQSQVGHPDLCRKLIYNGEECTAWLKGQGLEGSAIDPSKVPCFLLIVGSPERIPFDFSVRDLPRFYRYGHYAVGLLHFDESEQYARYAESLVAYETGEDIRQKSDAVLFATSDAVTRITAEHLVNPLASTWAEMQSAFPVTVVVGQNATRQALIDLLAPPASDPGPAFLFVASHGTEFSPENTRGTGSIRCQDGGTLSAEDVLGKADVRIQGMFAFLNACYSAGMPCENYRPWHIRLRPNIRTEKSFLSELPKALLSHQNGAAIGCIGHIERAVVTEAWSDTHEHLRRYRSALEVILSGRPVGLALRDFREDAKEYQAMLAVFQTQSRWQEKEGVRDPILDQELVQAWCSWMETSSYVLIGDPAARLHVPKSERLHSTTA